MRFYTIITAMGVSLSAMTAGAQTNGDIGKAMAVIDVASASGQVGDRALSAGSEVFIGDLVATDTVGEAQLLFTDGTRMVVGPNSSIVIDEFVFRGKAAENKFAARALGGTYRFISGFVSGDGDTGDDSRYSIKTPTSAIGVRGTAFDFTVTPGEGTKLVMLKGEATLCDDSGNCATADTTCELLNADLGRAVEEIEIDDGRVEETRMSFPYLIRQSSLLESFRVVGHGCADGAAASDPSNSGLGGGDDDGTADSGADAGNAGHDGRDNDDSSGESDGGDSDGGESDGGESDGGESDGGESDGRDSDGGESDGGESDGGESDGGESDGGESDGGESDGGESDGGESDGGESDGGETEGGQSEGGDVDGGGQTEGGGQTGGDTDGGGIDGGGDVGAGS